MKKALSCALFILALNAVNAQMVYRDVLFKRGDRYEKVVAIKSNSVMQRGEQTINLEGRASVSRSYVVNDTTVGSYSFKITTEKVADTLKGMGQQMEYNSEKPPGTGSLLEKILKRLIGRSNDLVINKKGRITTETDTFPLSQDDSLMSLSNLLSDKLIVGNTLELIAGLPAPDLVKKGSKWTDTILTTGGKQIIQYVIKGITDSITTISFKGNGITNHNYVKGNIVIKDYYTSVISGYMVVDNNTSVVIRRVINIDNNGSQTIAGTSVSTEKKSIIVETVKKNEH